MPPMKFVPAYVVQHHKMFERAYARATRAEREAAAQCCDAVAADRAHSFGPPDSNADIAATSLGFGIFVAHLAQLAFEAVPDGLLARRHPCLIPWAEQWAEAAAWLRAGWQR